MRKSVAKIILFGSLAEGRAEEESDVDLFIVALDDLPAVSRRCAEASLETTLRYGEQVEPIVGCVDRYLREDSYFFRQVLRGGEEVYTVEEEEIRWISRSPQTLRCAQRPCAGALEKEEES
ncbi:MAG: nucleotidyltransferase domain-containing protein [Anaerolineae bacterium]